MSMDRDRDYTATDTGFGSDPDAGRKGGTLSTPYPGSVPTASRGITRTEAGEVAYLGISRASWSSIWAGFFVGAMTHLLLATLGVALGISWVSDDQVAGSAFRTATGIWLIASSLISFFVGGFVTARMARLPGRGTGAMNGFLYGCFAWVLLMLLAVTPALNMLPSFASLFTQMGGAPNMGMGQTPNARLDAAQSAAWWGFFGLILSLAAATVGGLVGARDAGVDPLQTGAEHTGDNV